MENKVYDLKKRTYVFALDVIRFLESLPKDYISIVIGKQLLRSATSVGANVVEAQASSSKKDFINFYNYSLKSANETIFWLSLLKDANRDPNQKIPLLLSETQQLSKILAASILTMKGKRKP
ncbi:MAG: four helix bundle protein [Candidatus Omnitrophota bacterium]